MSSFEFDHITVLNEHGNRLLASLYSVNKYLNVTHRDALSKPEVNAIYKALKDGKTIDQEKFPHVSVEMAKAIGKILREPFAVAAHYHNFQTKALDALRDVLNESKNFDISWNYVFVMPVFKLFTNYVRLNIFVNSIENYDKAAMLYGYCYHMVQKTECTMATSILTSINERRNYKKMVSEMQQMQDRFFSLYKGNISIIYRLLHSGITHTWKELNLNDNPNPNDKKSLFLRPEYIIMQNMQLFYECFEFFCLVCGQVLVNNHQFYDVFLAILAHSSFIPMYGDFKVNAKELLIEMGKVTKKNPFGSVADEINTKRAEIKPMREFRQRKLTMILNEYLSAAKFDSNIIMNKLSVIQAIMGFANYEIHSELQMWNPETSSQSLLTLLAATSEMVEMHARHFEAIQRFLIFNFHEYDAPYLNSLLHSFTIPQSNYNRLALVIEALNSVDIEKHDSGTRYNLVGVEINLIREIAAFNYYSRSRGVIHLAPLFALISAIFYRVNIYNNLKMHFLNTCTLHKLWGYNQIFLSFADSVKKRYYSQSANLFRVAHYYSYDDESICEIPDFKENIIKYYEELKTKVLQFISRNAQNLQIKKIPDLIKQTKVGATDVSDTEKDPHQKHHSISGFPIGKESLLSSRKILQSIYSRIEAINQVISDSSKVCSIHLFDKKIDVLSEIQTGINKVFVGFYDDIKFDSPFQANDQIEITKIIFQNLMYSAGMNYTAEYNKCYKLLCNVSVEKDSNGKLVIKDDMGSISLKFKNIYSQFLTDHLKQSYFSNTGQMFVSNNMAIGKLPSLLASPSAIRVIYHLLGISGIIMIDVLSAEVFVQITDELVNLFNSTKQYDKLQSAISTESGQGWIREFIRGDKNAPTFIQHFCHLGAIARFRRLLRSSIGIPLDAKIGSLYQYQNEYDPVLGPMLDSHPLSQVFTNSNFSKFVGSLFASPVWSSVEYIVGHNCFSNNAHLIAMGIECILNCLVSTNKELPVTDILKCIIDTGFHSMQAGAKNLAEINKKAKFPSMEMHLIFDHVIENSSCLDYSYLEPIIPYQTIRLIYTVLMSRH